MRQPSVGLGYPGYRGDLQSAGGLALGGDLAAGTEAVMAARRAAAGRVPAWIEPMLATPDGGDTAGAEPPRLTERETDVLRLVAKGLSHRMVVENDVQSTLRKLQLHNRVELARYAIEHGIDEE